MLNSIKYEALGVIIAILLASWLVGGCKEAVEPIKPVHQHHQEEAEARRNAPPPSLPENIPPHPGTPGYLDVVDDLDEAVELAKRRDPDWAVKGLRSLGEFIAEGTPQQRDVALGVVREVFLHANYPKVRSQAAQALSRDFDQTCSLLLQALNEKDITVLETVCNILSQHSSKPGLIQRVRGLLNHPDKGIGRGAASALIAMHNHSRNVTGLINLLGVYKYDISTKAAIALTMMGRETVPELIHALKTSPNADRRHGAAMVLAMICGGASPKQQKFAELAHSEMEAYLRKPVPPPLRKAVEPLIDALRHDDSARVREISAQGLGYLGDARAAPALAEALAKDPSAAVRRRAAAALITVPARAVRGDIEKAALTDESAAVRRYAAEALGWIGSPAVVPALIDITRDESPEVRRYAAVQLGKLAEEGKLAGKSHNDVLLALVELFDDEDSDVRWAAVVSVGALRDEAAVRLLVKALDDPASTVSHAAERGLQKIGLMQRKAEEFKKQ